MKKAIYVRLANYICKFSLCKLYAPRFPEPPSISSFSPDFCLYTCFFCMLHSFYDYFLFSCMKMYSKEVRHSEFTLIMHCCISHI